MRVALGLLLLTMCVAPRAGAETPQAVALGARHDTVIQPAERECSDGVLFVNHDGSFENAYAWDWSANDRPYYGAWGEAFDLGCGWVECGAYWLTESHCWAGQPADIYVWDQGVSAEPGTVLALIVGVVFEGMPTWPRIRQFDVPIELEVARDFTIGFWGDWPWAGYGFFICADEDGSGGIPWTCVSPVWVPQYPTGWQHPGVVDAFGDCRGLGLGAYFTAAPSPAESRSWGVIKALFAK